MSTPEEDDVWRSIVENYGDRAELPSAEPDVLPDRDRAWPEPEEGVVVEPGFLDSLEEGFVPPPAPPIAPPRGLRLLAWLGVLAVPCLVLVLFVFRVWIAPWAGFMLFCWFVGGFGYLVANMRNPGTDGDGWDDGAVV